MQRPQNPIFDSDISVQLANDALDAVGITAAERQALLLTPHTEFCRDLHALDSAAVVLLFKVARPKDETRMVQAGPSLYGDNGFNWLANSLCCEGSGLDKELLQSAIEAGAVFDVHALPFAVESSKQHSKSATLKLKNLCSRSSMPPCNKVFDDWLTYLAQPGRDTLFVLCCGRDYWKDRPWFQALAAESATEQGRLIQRSKAVMQQHKTIDQGWKLSNQYYRQQGLDRISSAIDARTKQLQQTPMPPPALPPTAAYPLRLRLREGGGNAPPAAPAAAAPAGAAVAPVAATPAAAAVAPVAAAPAAAAVAPVAAAPASGTAPVPNSTATAQPVQPSTTCPSPAPVPAAAAGPALTAAEANGSGSLHRLPQQQPQNAGGIANAAAAALPVIKPDPEPAMQELQAAWEAQAGSAARELLTEALACGFPWPDEPQRQYFLLADLPFNAEELLSLHQKMCGSYIATRFVSSEPTRRGTVRDSLVRVPIGVSYVERMYSSESFPGVAAGLLQLRDAVPGLAQGTWEPQPAAAAEGAAGAGAAAAAAGAAEAMADAAAAAAGGGSAAATAANKLLLALRCVQQWEGNSIQQPQLPALLQLLLFGAPRSCCSPSDIKEVVDFTQQEEDEEAAREMEAGDMDLKLVREVVPRSSKRAQRSPAGAAAAGGGGDSGAGPSTPRQPGAAKRVKREPAS